MMIEFKDGFATASGEVVVHAFNLDTYEYAGRVSVHVSEGTTLAPGQSLEAPPKTKTGHAVVRQGDKWVLVENHRGTAYRTADGVAVDHQELGPLPDGLTSLAPGSIHDRWDGTAWVLDEEAAARAEQEQTIARARAYLLGTDWYVTRQQETGKAVPEGVTACRIAAREVLPSQEAPTFPEVIND